MWGGYWNPMMYAGYGYGGGYGGVSRSPATEQMRLVETVLIGSR